MRCTELQTLRNLCIRWDPPEDLDVLVGTTACVIYQVRAANLAACQRSLLWLITRTAHRAIAEQKVGFSQGKKKEKRNETDIWIPDWGMVKRGHNHTCGLSEMLIRVASELDFLSTNCGARVTREMWELPDLCLAEKSDVVTLDLIER